MEDVWTSNIPFLENLPESSIQGILDYIKPIHHCKKDFLFLENDAVADIYYIVSGIVRLTKSDNHGKEITLGYRKAGELLTCGILFDLDQKESHYFVTGQMLEAGEIIAISLEGFEKVLKDNPELAVQILRVNQNRMFDFTNTIRNLAFLDKHKALFLELLRLAEQHGIETEEGIKIDLCLSHQEIANKIATSREFVSKCLSDLSKQNIIKSGRRTITILDLSQLALLAK